MKTKNKPEIKLKNKLKSKRGETLIEVLVSLLIVVLIFIMLPSAVTLAANFNKQAKDKEISTMMDRAASPVAGAVVTVDYTFGVAKNYNVSVNAYESEDYCFYDYE